MSEGIRDRYEKTSLFAQFVQNDQCRWPPELLGACSRLVFSLRCLVPEFAAAGGEMINHGASPFKSSPMLNVQCQKASRFSASMRRVLTGERTAGQFFGQAL